MAAANMPPGLSCVQCCVTEGMLTRAWALWLPAVEQVEVDQILKLAQSCSS